MNERDEAEVTSDVAIGRDDSGRFARGNAGRPKGSRNKLGEAFLAELYVDFQQHGKAVIEQVRCEKPDVYLKIIAAILPAQIDVKVDPLEEMSDADLDRHIRTLIRAVAQLEPVDADDDVTVLT